MSYTNEEKKEALVEQNAIINKSGLHVIDMEKERLRQIRFFYVWLIAIGLLIVGVCVCIYGV